MALPTVPTTSTIPAFRAALLTQLQARPALAEVLVTDGNPPAPAKEYIALGATIFEQEWSHLGKYARNERYRQVVMISVLFAGTDTQVQAAARAFVLYAEVEDELRDDPTLGLDNLIGAQVGDGVYTPRWDDQYRQADLTFEINVHARI